MMADDDTLDLLQRNAQLEKRVEMCFCTIEALVDANARLRHELFVLQTEQLTMKGALK